jgi:hypothetical protein
MQAGRMHNEETMLMRSVTETLVPTWHQPEMLLKPNA